MPIYTQEFWTEREDWSRRKHLIAEQYLLPATAKLRSASADERVVIVDGFAGRGTYEDGSDGSPIEMCKLAERCRGWQRPVNLTIYNTEPDKNNFQNLCDVTKHWVEQHVVRNLNGTFQDYLPQIMREAGSSSMVAFLDPFRPSHLLLDDFSPLLRRGSPTDILIVFHTPAVFRTIRAASAEAKTEEKIKEGHFRFLDSVFGNTDWRQLLDSKSLDSEEVVDCFMKSLLNRSGSGRSPYVCSTSIERAYKTDLKYHIVLFTRHIDGVVLINDAFQKERKDVFEQHRAGQMGFDFGDSPVIEHIELPESERRRRLEKSILSIGKETPDRNWTRKSLAEESILRIFGEYSLSEHRNAIKALASRNQEPRILSPRHKNGNPKLNEETSLTFKF